VLSDPALDLMFREAIVIDANFGGLLGDAWHGDGD